MSAERSDEVALKKTIVQTRVRTYERKGDN